MDKRTAGAQAGQAPSSNTATTGGAPASPQASEAAATGAAASAASATASATAIAASTKGSPAAGTGAKTPLNTDLDSSPASFPRPRGEPAPGYPSLFALNTYRLPQAPPQASQHQRALQPLRSARRQEALDEDHSDTRRRQAAFGARESTASTRRQQSSDRDDFYQGSHDDDLDDDRDSRDYDLDEEDQDQDDDDDDDQQEDPDADERRPFSGSARRGTGKMTLDNNNQAAGHLKRAQSPGRSLASSTARASGKLSATDLATKKYQSKSNNPSTKISMMAGHDQGLHSNQPAHANYNHNHNHASSLANLHASRYNLLADQAMYCDRCECKSCHKSKLALLEGFQRNLEQYEQRNSRTKAIHLWLKSIILVLLAVLLSMLLLGIIIASHYLPQAFDRIVNVSRSFNVTIAGR